MNRLVLIGNGFDLAHGLKTNYKDFIDAYWHRRILQMVQEKTNASIDCLCSFERKDNQSWCTYATNNFRLPYRKMPGFEHRAISDKEIIYSIISDPHNVKRTFSPFFDRIHQSIETKNWVDIENEYYSLLKEYSVDKPSENKLKELNEQLNYLQDLLLMYLTGENKKDVKVDNAIMFKIYSPIEPKDIAVEWQGKLNEYIDWCFAQEEDVWEEKLLKYDDELSYADIDISHKGKDYPRPFMLPDDIMLLSFNYTNTARKYLKPGFRINYIHGELEKPDSVIFGYGDELDEDFKKIKELDNSECRKNIKSIKYLEAAKYREVLQFIESAPFQVCIMGHSCGNSDRTLLNTLFEHKNCISIKPYFYKRDDGSDNYLDIVQNISRNFTDMKLMRDRVVNKTYCKPLRES